ncbi:unnamed protein product [Orchesella dallaii]|uniref:Uncharacterized protein n=1 Tax=Orchesella dallaii TaxID=48710 RepID=A0ABP1PU48_9HEXA
MANKKRLVRDAKEIIKRLNSEYETMEEFCQVKALEIAEVIANLKHIWDKPPHSSDEAENRLCLLKELALDVLEEFQDKLENVMSINSEVMNVMCQFKHIYQGKKWSTLTRNDCLELRRLLENCQLPKLNICRRS